MTTVMMRCSLWLSFLRFPLLTIIYPLLFSAFGSLAAVVTGLRRLVSVADPFCGSPRDLSFSLSLSLLASFHLFAVSHTLSAHFFLFPSFCGVDLAYMWSCNLLSIFCTYIVSGGEVIIQGVINIHQRMARPSVSTAEPRIRIPRGESMCH